MKHTQERARTVDDQDLLPSQQALLSTEAVSPEGFSFIHLGRDQQSRLGEIFAYDLSLAQAARDISDLTDRDGNVLYGLYSKEMLRELNRVAIELIQLNDTFVTVSSKDSFGDYEEGTYTPSGMVKYIEGDLKQKVITIDMTTFHEFGGGPTERILQVYTDNLATKSPLWEFQKGSMPLLYSDISPNGYPREYDPLYGHYPQGFESEELAFATIDSLRRMISKS